MKKRRRNTTKKGTQYEYHVAWKMRLHGYYFVRVIGHSSDYGGDVIARCFPFGSIVVQCKNLKAKLGYKLFKRLMQRRSITAHQERQSLQTATSQRTLKRLQENAALICGGGINYG